MAEKQCIGRFYWMFNPLDETDDNLDPKQRARLADIVSYYTDAVIETILIPIISKSETGGRLSLRALDWLVTNYSKKKPVVYKIAPPNHPTIPVNIHNDYKSWLNNHKRRNFDMFRRRKRIFFDFNEQTFETTVGQLNFFFWAARYGVIDYAKTNLLEIEADHAVSTKRQVESGCTDADREDDSDETKDDATDCPDEIKDDSTDCPDETKDDATDFREKNKDDATDFREKNKDTSNRSCGPFGNLCSIKRKTPFRGMAKLGNKRASAKNKNGIVRRRRRELSKAPHSKCFVYSMAIEVVFNNDA